MANRRKQTCSHEALITVKRHSRTPGQIAVFVMDNAYKVAEFCGESLRQGANLKKQLSGKRRDGSTDFTSQFFEKK